MLRSGLVGVKRVIDYAVKVRVRPDGKGVIKENVQHSMNPFDEIALEEAVRLKEKKLLQQVIALSIGTAKSQEVLRTALAKGADKAILVEVDNETAERIEPLHVAKIMQHVVSNEAIDVVLVGKQAIDDDSCQTGQLLSGLLDWPIATFVSNIQQADGNMFNITREIDGGLEMLTMKCPMIVTADLRLNEPRYATLPNIMKAKKKPLQKLKLSDLGIDFSYQTQILQVSEPPKRKAGTFVEDVQSLIMKLKESGLVMSK
ncbi:unnamed protein product [Anisakis simplex]|uniref:Electron transfer flavoprotein subunit beta n=1 Tax=Anisakis simplex TaxID=6269 RepID=A0A0M3JYV4_ANISI|nr:unnamed protein product [Anisakis simplex]